MPELPEVESIRRYLVASNIQGATIQRVEIGWPDSIAAPAADIETFANKVSNTQIGTLSTAEANTWYHRSSTATNRSLILVLHMGMTGSLHVRNPDDDPVRYRRAAFYLRRRPTHRTQRLPKMGPTLGRRRSDNRISANSAPNRGT